MLKWKYLMCTFFLFLRRPQNTITSDRITCSTYAHDCLACSNRIRCFCRRCLESLHWLELVVRVYCEPATEYRNRKLFVNIAQEFTMRRFSMLSIETITTILSTFFMDDKAQDRLLGDKPFQRHSTERRLFWDRLWDTCRLFTAFSSIEPENISWR